MVKVSIDLHINRSAKEVFEFISNMENNPLWQQGMESCQITNNIPLRVGQEYDQVAHFLGQTIVSRFKIIEYEPDYLIKATTIKGPIPITFTRIVIGDDYRCEVKSLVEGEGSKFFKVFEPALERMVYKMIHRDYYRLKDMMER